MLSPGDGFAAYTQATSTTLNEVQETVACAWEQTSWNLFNLAFKTICLNNWSPALTLDRYQWAFSSMSPLYSRKPAGTSGWCALFEGTSPQNQATAVSASSYWDNASPKLQKVTSGCATDCSMLPSDPCPTPCDQDQSIRWAILTGNVHGSHPRHKKANQLASWERLRAKSVVTTSKHESPKRRRTKSSIKSAERWDGNGKRTTGVRRLWSLRTLLPRAGGPLRAHAKNEARSCKQISDNAIF